MTNDNKDVQNEQSKQQQQQQQQQQNDHKSQTNDQKSITMIRQSNDDHDDGDASADLKQDGKWIENLPKQPIPDLKLTLQRYISGLEPVIISKTQMKQTKQMVKKFYGENLFNDIDVDDSDGDSNVGEENSSNHNSSNSNTNQEANLSEGKRLQQLLIEYAQQTDNWSTDFWLDDMYLTNPLPLLINSNPFFLLPKQTFNHQVDMLRFASIFVRFSLLFHEQIVRKTLKQDMTRGRLLCMQTYRHFFSAYRIPDESKDILFINENNLSEQQQEKHFIVAAFNQFTCVTITEPKLPTINELCDCLSMIWLQSKKLKFQKKANPPVGILTTENRKTWAKIRMELIKDETNARNLHLIETSMFILCLDDFIMSTIGTKPSSSSSSSCSQQQRQRRNSSNVNYRNSIQIAKMDPTYMGSMLLHGGGSDIHTSNRWWDKFMQIIVSKEGICGVIMEHSASEGMTMINFLEKFLKYYEKYYRNPVNNDNNINNKDDESIKKLTQETNRLQLLRNTSLEWQLPSQNSVEEISSTIPKLLKILPLQWNINDNSARAIEQAEKHANKLIIDLDFYILRFNEYGSDFIKQQHLSPDAFIQLALQLTYYKLHRRIVSTYESCALRQFRYGRVDTIRASTLETKQWAESMCPPQQQQQQQPEHQQQQQQQSELTSTSKTNSIRIGNHQHHENNRKFLNVEEENEEDQKIKLFKRAIQKQVEIMYYTSNGFGPENHLRALRELSRIHHGGTIPSLFREKSFGEYGNYRLSTSQLPTESDIIVGYGPVVNDGYGCSYCPKRNQIIFCVSSFFSSNETSSDFFALSLESSLLQMRELCLRMNSNGSSSGFSARTPEPPPPPPPQ